MGPLIRRPHRARQKRRPPCRPPARASRYQRSATTSRIRNKQPSWSQPELSTGQQPNRQDLGIGSPRLLTVEGAENLETEGGYAKEASDDFKKKQEELLTETLKKIDIIICTALIPGKEAPKIIKEEMFKNLQSGSVIYDLAAIQGGNTVFTEVDKIVEKNGVKILGEANILNKLPVSASNLYAKNVFNFISNLYDKENNKLNINLEDEIIEKTLIK